MSKVFLGIRTYNQEKYMDACFDSVLKQDCPDMHLVVLDDKSSDATMSKLQEWKDVFAQKGIAFDIYQNEEHSGCGKSFENLGRKIAEKMGDDDTFVMLDSDDKFTSSDAVRKCVQQMEKNNANICIAGFDLSGDMELVLNWNSGTPHNNLSKKLAEVGSSSVVEMPEIASHADSIGWTKIVKGNIFKKYMGMYPKVSKEMKVCEDFPSLAMLLFKDAKITGLSENMYDYYKHKQSSTAQVVPEDFKVVRLGFLKSLQKMVADNKSQFIEDADKYINKFLEVKYIVIGNIVDKKNQSGDLKGYNKQDWEKDFQSAIDCRDLRIEKKSKPKCPEQLFNLVNAVKNYKQNQL